MANSVKNNQDKKQKTTKGNKYVIKGFISFKIVIENQHFCIFL